MKIAVCIKRVPDSETRVKIASDGMSLDQAGVKFILNPYDEFAVEEGLRRKEQAGAGEVAVIAVGPPAAQETIRTALAMGADRGVLLQTDRIPTDGLAVARALAAELKDGGYDLILLGKIAIDDHNQQMGPMVAESLGLPCVTAVFKLEIAGGTGTAEREVEGGIEVVDFPLPAVVTADKGLNEPRLPALKGIMAAKKKPLEVKPLQAEALSTLDPSQMVQNLMAGDRIRMETELTDLKLLLPDGTEVPAAPVVLRDKDLDLAFIRPKAKPESPMTFVDLNDAGKAELADPLLAMNRLGNAAGRAFSASAERVSAIVQRPRLFYIPDSNMTTSSLGCPAFTLDGKVLGIMVMRTARGSASASALNSQNPNYTGIVLPSADVLKIAKQAPETASEPEAPKEPEAKAPEEAKEKKAAGIEQ